MIRTLAALAVCQLVAVSASAQPVNSFSELGPTAVWTNISRAPSFFTPLTAQFTTPDGDVDLTTNGIDGFDNFISPGTFGNFDYTFAPDQFIAQIDSTVAPGDYQGRWDDKDYLLNLDPPVMASGVTLSSNGVAGEGATGVRVEFWSDVDGTGVLLAVRVSPDNPTLGCPRPLNANDCAGPPYTFNYFVGYRSEATPIRSVVLQRTATNGNHTNIALDAMAVADPVVESACIPDVSTSGSNPGDAGFGEPDGSVDVSDLTYFVETWIGGGLEADLTTSGSNPGDADYGVPDEMVDVSDLTFFVEAWIAGCP
ncbi:MAG: GC-type dockerin domain-anchored protein [Planctomycetota bacterium]